MQRDARVGDSSSLESLSQTHAVCPRFLRFSNRRNIFTHSIVQNAVYIRMVFMHTPDTVLCTCVHDDWRLSASLFWLFLNIVAPGVCLRVSSVILDLTPNLWTMVLSLHNVMIWRICVTMHSQRDSGVCMHARLLECSFCCFSTVSFTFTEKRRLECVLSFCIS